ncbi:MAG: sigma-70 family RNA polymerase sigma factor [Myxococcales bacterium]|nr:sigma-70 family RNA polymerase sigma factor [Myxococcales bacterium]
MNERDSDIRAALLRVGQREHPDVPLTADELTRFLDLHADANADAEADADEASLRAGDVYLAASCAAWHDEALARFEALYWPRLRSAIGARGLSAAATDEAMQRLREHLFVERQTRRAAIYSYNGRHPLEAWLRVVALRIALALLRKTSARREDDDRRLERVLGAERDPELRYLKQRSSAQLKAILADVLAALEPRDRTLLRQRFVHGLSFVEMARIYDVDASRPRRWITRIRDAVREATRQRVMSELQLSPTECESLFRFVDGELDLTISRHLASEP